MNASLDDAVSFAKHYLEDLLSFFGLNADISATSDDDIVQLAVPSTHLNGFLIGQGGENMRSMQYLTSNALKNNDFTHNRVIVDIADYKKQREARVRERAEEWMQRTTTSQQPIDLPAMNAAERRIVHQVAAEHGVTSDSIGDGRDRHIVLRPPVIEA